MKIPNPQHHNKNTVTYKIQDRLYINITDRCTLTCLFCPKQKGSYYVHNYDLQLNKRPHADSVIAQINDPRIYKEIVFCGYGEPTLRLKTILEISKYIKSGGGKVRINTDGLANRVNKRNVLSEMAGIVDTLSVSLTAQNRSVYERHCQPAFPGAYESVIEFLTEAPAYVPNVVATAISGLEDVDIEACEQIAKRLGVEFRARTLDVVG